MILTSIPPDSLPELLARFTARLYAALPRTVFGRMAMPAAAERARGSTASRHHRQAMALLASFGMEALPGAPAEDFSWNGHAVRAETEAYVLLHEVAHFQLAAPGRRRRIDFGLGPGPETGDTASAQSAAVLFGLPREREEAMASLLGILWEVELGQPGLASFLDQNWLEGAGRPGTAAHFEDVLGRLVEGGFVSRAGRPTRRLRMISDSDPRRSGG